MKKMYSITRKKSRSLFLDVFGALSNPSNGVRLLNSHLLTMEEDLDSSFFDNQLKKLSKKSTIIPFLEAVELIKKKREVKYSLIAFSYDDGFQECHTHIAPVLEKYNGYAVFFINPNFIDGNADYIASFLKDKVHLPYYKKPMNWEQIKELEKKGHIIGAHTMDHIRISAITKADEINKQIGKCKSRIYEKAAISTEYFAFPYGHPERDFNIDSVAIAERYYKYIFSASNWRKYYSYNNRVFNRRHCEPYWKPNHINYFLSKTISY